MIRRDDGFLRMSKRRPRMTAGALEIIGKTLLAMSLGVLLALAWTLWGTKAAAQREQKHLAVEFDQEPAFFKVEAGESMPPLVPPEDYEPPAGKGIFRLRIPKMKLNEIVVEGVEPDQLDVAPGHYPSCRKGQSKELCTPWDVPFPGEPGRMIISGHRTTHGAPFWDLNLLHEGDPIHIETKWGNFVYEVERQRIVDDESRRIVIPTDRTELVLTACHPRFSAAQRLVVIAELAEAEPPS